MKTKTYLPLFSGFYNSHWDEPCFDGEEEIFDLPKGMYFEEFIDWTKYHEHIAKEMCNEVQYLLSDFVSDIEFEKISSPKYYNFENDSIHCEIDFNEEKVMEYLNENQDAFSTYIKNNYTSRDGFISSYENNASEWLHEWQNDSHKVGSVLQFICENEGFEEPWDLNDCHVSLFYNQQIYQYERTDFSH
jgi:hypothetical protein